MWSHPYHLALALVARDKTILTFMPSLIDSPLPSHSHEEPGELRIHASDLYTVASQSDCSIFMTGIPLLHVEMEQSMLYLLSL